MSWQRYIAYIPVTKRQEKAQKKMKKLKKSGVDIKKDLNISELIKETEEEIKQPMDQMLTDIKHTVNYEPPAKKRVNVESDDDKNIENEGD